MTKIAAEFYLPPKAFELELGDAVKRLKRQAAEHTIQARYDRAATLLLAAEKMDRIDRQRAEMAAYD